MAYKSIDELQKTLSETVFKHTQDAKKAAGRALGTLIEIITYYLLNEWNFSNNVSIERGLEEYGNAQITHNVEFSLHPIVSQITVQLVEKATISAKQIALLLNLDTNKYIVKNNAIFEKATIIKNACVIAESDDTIVLATSLKQTKNGLSIQVVEQCKSPYAMFECKRVGVEEGNKKGPQTIEKAKQGAYVAQMVSSLQKIRNEQGERYGLLFESGTYIIKPYFELLQEIIYHKSVIPANFILSIGVVSNHGNWFTAEDQNKELKVLAQSYDWLLFLSDNGLAEFITDLLLSPTKEYQCVKDAFLVSYQEGKKSNVFTKVKMDVHAHQALISYFHQNITRIEGWFNIISPMNYPIGKLKEELNILTSKS